MKKILLLILLILITVSCSNNELSKKDTILHANKGKEIGQALVKNLGKNLMANMKQGGPKQAIPFCNVAANPLTQEIATKHNVSIKRTSHKIRNSNNIATLEEKSILTNYLNSLDNKKVLKPIVKKETDGKIHFYAPILLEKKCLACHGTIGKEVTYKTDSILKVLYPNDKATGFEIGDLRGVVNIGFN